METNTYSRSSGDSAQGTEDEIGILVRHKRDDQVESTEPKEAVCEDCLCRVEVCHTTPK